MKFRFIKCQDHNKHSSEAIPESEGLLFFQGTSIDRNIGKYPHIVLNGGRYNLGSQRSGNESFSNPNPVNCPKRSSLQLTD